MPGLVPGVVRAPGAQVRRLDEPAAPLGLQHHLELGEGLAVALAPLVVERAAAHHVAGGRLADLALGVALRARRVRLALVRQVAQDGAVALLARHRGEGRDGTGREGKEGGRKAGRRPGRRRRRRRDGGGNGRARTRRGNCTSGSAGAR